jgi:hypothetical protein
MSVLLFQTESRTPLSNVSEEIEGLRFSEIAVASQHVTNYGFPHFERARCSAISAVDIG